MGHGGHGAELFIEGLSSVSPCLGKSIVFSWLVLLPWRAIRIRANQVDYPVAVSAADLLFGQESLLRGRALRERSFPFNANPSDQGNG